MAGHVLDLFRRQLEHIDAERNALRLKCNSSDDELVSLRKRLEASESNIAEYLRRYEEVINDKQKISKDYSGRIAELQNKSSKLEERCMGLSSSLETAKRESTDWKRKYEHNILQQKADESKLKSQIASMESRVNISEGRLSAVREQAESAQEEASEWKRKYDVAVSEAKSALQRAAVAQERTNKKVQEREDALRAEISHQLSEKVILSPILWCIQYYFLPKSFICMLGHLSFAYSVLQEEEIAKLNAKINQTEIHATSLISRLEVSLTLPFSHSLPLSVRVLLCVCLVSLFPCFCSGYRSKAEEP